MAAIAHVEGKGLSSFAQGCSGLSKAPMAFLTLTVKNCPIEDLRKTLDWMNKSFIRLTKLNKFWNMHKS